MPEMIALEKDLHMCMRISICLDWISELCGLKKYLYTCMRIRILLDWVPEMIALEKYLYTCIKSGFICIGFVSSMVLTSS